MAVKGNHEKGHELRSWPFMTFARSWFMTCDLKSPITCEYFVTNEQKSWIIWNYFVTNDQKSWIIWNYFMTNDQKSSIIWNYFVTNDQKSWNKPMNSWPLIDQWTSVMTCVLIGGKIKYGVCIGQFCKAQLLKFSSNGVCVLTVYFHPKHAGVDVAMRVLYKSGFKSNGSPALPPVHPCLSTLHNFIYPSVKQYLSVSVTTRSHSSTSLYCTTLTYFIG